MESNVKSSGQGKLAKVGIYAVILLIAFLAGLIPMWLSARTCEAEHAETKKLLVKEQIANLVSSAIVDSGRGEYETARQEASDFFTKLNAEIDKAEGSAYKKEQIDKLKSVFDTRDALITLLAQRDQASSARLTDIYLKYQSAIGEPKPVSAGQIPANANSQ
jgi:hypothetical protein